MTTATLRSSAGTEVGSVDLDEAMFGIEPNVPVMHQVVTAQLAAKRQGTQSTKTRAEVRGGGAKPWKQKGTGRARAGSSRSPIWRGGGVALGPKPRKYDQKTPKKMKRLALASALSDRAADEKVVVIDDWAFETPSTKAAKSALTALDASGRVLVVLQPDDNNAWLSFRNLPDVHVLSLGELNTYDVLVSDVVIFTKDALPTRVPAKIDLDVPSETASEPRPLAEKPKPAPKAKPKAAPKPKAEKVEAAPEASDDDEAPADSEPVADEVVDDASVETEAVEAEAVETEATDESNDEEVES
jgi:large subunit ribosomal protein L4